jgi:hypothetical protein
MNDAVRECGYWPLAHSKWGDNMSYFKSICGAVMAGLVLLGVTTAAHAQVNQVAGDARFLYLATPINLGTSGTQLQVLSEAVIGSTFSAAKTITASIILQNTGSANGFAECILSNGLGNSDKADINLAPNTIGTVAIVLASPTTTSGSASHTTLTCAAVGSNVRVNTAMAAINFVSHLEFQSCNIQGNCS